MSDAVTTTGSGIPAPWPDRFNLASYFLDGPEGGDGGDGPRVGRVALLCADRSQTYGELVERASRLAAALRTAGVRPEDRVLIALPDCFEFAAAFFGILRAGGVFAMVNPLLKRDDLRYYLNYTKARVVIGHAEHLDELGPAFDGADLCEHLWVVGDSAGEYDGFEALLAAEDPRSERARVAPTGPDDLAGWLFTSGSTGKPKACVHSHADFAYSTETYARQVVGYGPDEVCLSVPKLFFGYATGTNLMFPLRFGGRAVLFAGRSTADELLDQIELHRPTLMTGVPTLFSNLLRSPRIDDMDLSHLRVTLSAGEALPAELYRAWKKRTGVEILDGIGSAEMFHIYITNRPGDVRAGSLGRLVEGYEAQIIDPEGALLADGESGRLRVRGGSTAICYWGDRAKSVETFQGDWCTSADVFRRDSEGYFYYEGRSDDLMKVSGIWVSPLEI